MNKRSALLTASGLAASFVAGAAAFSVNWGLGSANGSTVAANQDAGVKPIVKHRTIVVHRKAPASAAGARPQTVVLPAPAPAHSTVVTTTGGSATAGGEHEDETEGGDD